MKRAPGMFYFFCHICFGSNPGHPPRASAYASRPPPPTGDPPSQFQDSSLQWPTFRTPTRDPPLPLLSRHLWGVTIFKHFNRYSKLKSDDTRGSAFKTRKSLYKHEAVFTSSRRICLPRPPGPPGSLPRRPAQLGSQVTASQELLLCTVRDLTSPVPKLQSLRAEGVRSNPRVPFTPGRGVEWRPRVGELVHTGHIARQCPGQDAEPKALTTQAPQEQSFPV